MVLDDQGTLLREPYAEANLDTAGSSINDIGKKFLIGAWRRALLLPLVPQRAAAPLAPALSPHHSPASLPAPFPAAERLSAARQAVGMA